MTNNNEKTIIRSTIGCRNQNTRNEKNLGMLEAPRVQRKLIKRIKKLPVTRYNRILALGGDNYPSLNLFLPPDS
jgi:hypothetical protein